MNKKVSAAAIIGALAVILGAFGAHAIAKKVQPSDLEIWKTAAHYHLVHAVALLALSLADGEDKFKATRYLWYVGIAVFGGSLYAMVLAQQRWLGAITPIGGLCLILGWLLIAFKSSQRVS